MSTKSLNLPLLTWDNPVKTGKIFGGAVSALIVLKSVNLLSLFFRLSSLVLFVSAAAEYGGKLILGQGLVTKLRPPKLSNSFSSRASKLLESFANDLPGLEIEGQELLYSVNVENTLKSAGLFYILYKITSWVSLYTLIFTSIVAAFTLPAIYEKYQVEINAAIKQASAVATEKLNETSKVIATKAGPYLKQADEKLGPVSSFIKQKYQVRTASSTVGEQNASAFTSSSETSTSKNPFENKTKEVPVDTTYSSTEPIATKPVPTPADFGLFPDAPKSEPLSGNSAVDQAKDVAKENDVDVDNLKNDLLKNKEAAIGAQF
jgi:hypothetical protein